MIVRQICDKWHKESPVSIEDTGLSFDIIISWRVFISAWSTSNALFIGIYPQLCILPVTYGEPPFSTHYPKRRSSKLYNMKIAFSEHVDYLLPEFLAQEAKSASLIRYGLIRLERFKKRRGVMYTHLKNTSKLNEHLANIDSQTYEMLSLLTSQMAQTDSITEAFKASN